MIKFTEVIKVEGGVFRNVEYHQQRINRTAARFGIPAFNLSDELQHASLPVDGSLMKCRIEYGEKIESLTCTPYTFKKISRVAAVVDNDVDYAYKFADRRHLEALRDKCGCDEVIIIKNGQVTDSSFSNLIFETAQHELFTPSACLLKGTKRQFLLDSGVITERAIRVQDIRDYERILFINAMMEPEDNIGIPAACCILP